MTLILTPRICSGVTVTTHAELRDWQKQTILEWLSYEGPSLTSAELASCGFELRVVERRLRSLEREGLVERDPARCCSETRRKAITWRAVARLCRALHRADEIEAAHARGWKRFHPDSDCERCHGFGLDARTWGDCDCRSGVERVRQLLHCFVSVTMRGFAKQSKGGPGVHVCMR